MDYLVDVNIATYNHEKYISQCIESVLAQKTSFKIRILIGEDCSQDNTAAIVKEYADKYPEIIFPFFHKENLGINNSMSNGLFILNKSKAKYIAVIDGDDYWIDPYKLQKQIDFLEKNIAYSMCFSRIKIYNEGTNTFSPFVRTQLKEKDTFVTEDILDGWFLQTSSVVFKREAIVNYPEWYHFYPYDISIVLLISLHGKLRFIDEEMSVYRSHSEGITKVKKKYDQLKRNVLKSKSMLEKFDDYTHYKYHDHVIGNIKRSDFFLEIIYSESYFRRINLFLKHFKYLPLRDKYRRNEIISLIFPSLHKAYLKIKK